MAMVYLSLLQMERSGSLTRWGGGEGRGGDVYIINWLSLVPGHLRCGQLDRKQFGLCWSNCVHGYDSFGYTTVWPHNCIHVLIFWVKTMLYCGRCQLCVCKPVRVILVQAGRGYCSGRSGLLFRPVGVILVQAGRGYCSGLSGLFLFRPVRVILFSSHRTTRSTSPSPSTISKPGWGAPPFTSLIAQMQVLFSVASQLTPVWIERKVIRYQERIRTGNLSKSSM